MKEHLESILHALKSVGLPEDASTHGHQVDQIIHLMHYFMIALFVGWFAFFLYTILKFRARAGHKANYAPKYSKMGSYLEIGVVLFEAGVLIALAIPAWGKIKSTLPDPDKTFEVRVVSEQFAWNAHYPGPDGTFGKTDISLINEGNLIGLDSSDPYAADDLVVINAMHFPKDRPILIRLSSKDVIHSFGVPNLRIKQDAVPGHVFPVYFEANKAGVYEIVCSQLCGLGHYRMRGEITIDEEQDFQTWFTQQKEMSSATEEDW